MCQCSFVGFVEFGPEIAGSEQRAKLLLSSDDPVCVSVFLSSCLSVCLSVCVCLCALVWCSKFFDVLKTCLNDWIFKTIIDFSKKRHLYHPYIVIIITVL